MFKKKTKEYEAINMRMRLNVPSVPYNAIISLFMFHREKEIGLL